MVLRTMRKMNRTLHMGIVRENDKKHDYLVRQDIYVKKDEEIDDLLSK